MNALKPKLTNPLDTLFETAQGMTDVATYDAVTEGALAELVAPTQSPEIDEEDTEINRKIDEVYTTAFDTFNQQMQYAEIVEPRYAARNAEVAASYLNIALSAAATRAKVKGDRKRTSAFIPYANRNPNGTVVASREDIMKLIAVDAETKEHK